jgi:hypothetical protein
MANMFSVQKGNRGAAHNTDKNTYNAHMAMRKKAFEDNAKINEINNLREEINQLKQDQQDIKQMLIQLLEKSK